MVYRGVRFGDEARRNLVAGINKCADAVAVTLGPCGRTVFVDKGWGAPLATKDGVTVARNVSFKDREEMQGAQLVIEASMRSNELAGDGTTLTCVLIKEMVKRCLKALEDGCDAQSLKRGMDKAKDAAFTILDKIKSTKFKIRDVARISANDGKLGDLVAEVMEKTGENGIVTVENGTKPGLEYELVRGMSIDRGMVSPYMITDGRKLECNLDNPKILVTDKRIMVARDILPLMENVIAGGDKNFVIFCEAIDSEALATIIANKQQNIFNTLAVVVPGFGEKAQSLLQDIAAVTGATFVSEKLGMKIADTTLEQLGSAKRVISTRTETSIVDGCGSKEKMEERENIIKEEINQAKNEYDKKMLEERHARLLGGIGVIRVLASTDIETGEWKHRLEDAVCAVRAARLDGIVAGGGMALRRVAQMLEVETPDFIEHVGIDIVKHAFAAPFNKIAENAGKHPEVILDRIYKTEDDNAGYDFAKDEVTDMMKSGIIDPCKVIKIALESAVSVAGLVATCEAHLFNLPEEKEEKSNKK